MRSFSHSNTVETNLPQIGIEEPNKIMSRTTAPNDLPVALDL